MKPTKVKALFISDLHLGADISNAEMVLDLLKQFEPEYLFLVGDIIDGWMLKVKMKWKQSHTNVIRKILSYSKKGTKVIYITGNHDDFLRSYDSMQLGNIEICNEYIFENAFIIHGDKYDGLIDMNWIGVLGGIIYDWAVSYDRRMRKLGVKISLSKWLKTKVKEAVKYIFNFESNIAKEAKRNGCDVAICGHIHKAEDKIIDGVRYINTGDWVENFTYVVFNDGKFTLHHHTTS